MYGTELDHLIQLLSKLPGLGPRSGRRVALHLIKHRESLMGTLIQALQMVSERLRTCTVCGNFDTQSQCRICTDPRRDNSLLCVVETVADVWALERGGSFRGKYHILGGVLSAINGVTPEQLNLQTLNERIMPGEVQEVILALSATVDGMTTAHYIVDQLRDCRVTVTGLAQGVPVGGELDYLDDGTLEAALSERRMFHKPYV